ncbi:NAD(P)-dependent oxidoreductase [Gluconobacter morbifer]|uniref:Putative oxidoreductase n=1 Tax=Gluconobacter morbifer G707 TaxID=1088869 RepID=G6XG60_9PROT|nr:NAD(P)-dependent oxidoreductase [Gluconobacter morbifer]EHH69168.1 putative oxidoreductase [Gluconobacter morbifer G707]
MKIAFIGLGAMGNAMAGRLLENGFDLTVYNRTRQKAAALTARGAKVVETPADAARNADIVFSMLLDDTAVEEMTFRKNGLADTLAPGAIHACCSTLSLEQARRLQDGHAERRQTYVSTTVLGRPPAAEAGKLFVIAAGEDDALERLTPALNCFGQTIFRVGQNPVQANLAKFSLNFMIFSTIEQMGEVFAINEKAGTDPKTIFEIMTGSFYNAPVHKNYGSLMVDHAYDKSSGAPVTLGYKDISLFLKAGEDYDTPLPYASIARDRLLATMSAGYRDEDFVVMLEAIRRDAGLSKKS